MGQTVVRHRESEAFIIYKDTATALIQIEIQETPFVHRCVHPHFTPLCHPISRKAALG